MYRLAYTGIGSRQTPPRWLAYFTKLATRLEELGYVLRSGGAGGADNAFNAGILDSKNAEIYLPWNGFNGHTSSMPLPNNEAFAMAAAYHPAWSRLKTAGKKFHARNCYQVLGAELRMQDRSSFIICWTPGGAVTGGTGQALRLAAVSSVPVFNFGRPDPENVIAELKQAIEGYRMAEEQAEAEFAASYEDAEFFDEDEADRQMAEIVEQTELG